eukprot:6148984-Alexandrium_andersonii.AAC.1
MKLERAAREPASGPFQATLGAGTGSAPPEVGPNRGHGRELPQGRRETVPRVSLRARRDRSPPDQRGPA